MILLSTWKTIVVLTISTTKLFLAEILLGDYMNNPVPVSLLSGDRGSSAIIRFGSFSMIRYIV